MLYTKLVEYLKTNGGIHVSLPKPADNPQLGLYDAADFMYWRAALQ